MHVQAAASQRPSQIALQQVIVCHLERHANPGVRWAGGPTGLTITVNGRETSLDLGGGLDGALRQVTAWGVLRG